ncbi:hypothetical protein ACU4HD_08865 [Cupriavidus basilensis]
MAVMLLTLGIAAPGRSCRCGLPWTRSSPEHEHPTCLFDSVRTRGATQAQIDASYSVQRDPDALLPFSPTISLAIPGGRLQYSADSPGKPVDIPTALEQVVQGLCTFKKNLEGRKQDWGVAFDSVTVELDLTIDGTKNPQLAVAPDIQFMPTVSYGQTITAAKGSRLTLTLKNTGGGGSIRWRRLQRHQVSKLGEGRQRTLLRCRPSGRRPSDAALYGRFSQPPPIGS